jgi:hypothetical protein
MACRVVAREASEGWWAHSNLAALRVKKADEDYGHAAGEIDEKADFDSS